MRTGERRGAATPGRPRVPRPGRRSPLVLAGDIGGSKTNIGLFEMRRGRFVQTDHQRYPSASHADLDAILREFLRTRPVAVNAAGFGVAGPVFEGRCTATNLPWVVDARPLSRLVRAPVALMNDLEATAHAIPHLRAKELRTLNRGRAAAHGNLAIIAAGTGLGEAFVVRREGRFLVCASEGGHSSFSPRSEEEIRLLRILRKRYGHVSFERLLSGQGLTSIYDALGRTRNRRDRLLSPATPDRAAAISEAALQHRSPRAARALRLFATIYGSEAGNLALKYLATGGVYLGGGIAPRILPALAGGHFIRAFVDKGRFHKLLASVPVSVILDEGASLRGAASVALSLAGG